MFCCSRQFPTFIMALCTLIGCQATTRHARTTGSARSLDASGVVALSDGQVVAEAEVRAVCGRKQHAARTNAKGVFTLRGVAEGSCMLTVVGTRFSMTTTIGKNLLREQQSIKVVLPPSYHTLLAWRDRRDPSCRAIAGAGGCPDLVKSAVSDFSGEVTLDSRIAQPVLIRKHRLTFENGNLTANGTPLAALSELTEGQQLDLDKHIQLTVKDLKSRPWLPLSLRPTPREGDLEAVAAYASGKLTKLGAHLGKRTIIVVAACDAVRDDWRTDVDGLGESYKGIGLKALTTAVGACSEKTAPKKVLFVGEELLWALGARLGQVVIVGEGAQVLHRSDIRKGRLLEDAVAYLEKSWPSFAALQRVTLQKGDSVSASEAERLLTQASALVKANKPHEAHRILAQILLLVPDNIEAHRQLALTKAQLGDLSGALNEVGWWRTSFGDLAAEELMDAVRRTAKVSSR